MTPLLEIRQLEVCFSSWWPRHTIRAVDQVDLTLSPGERVGLVGESGCGKSTLISAALGAVPPTGGTIQLFGRPLRARVGARGGPDPQDVQAVFQSIDAHIDPAWTCQALLNETARRFGRPTTSMTAALERVGLGHRRHAHAQSLSGGEQRRLGLARVLLVQPRLLLADEPCAGVDAGRRLDLVAALQEGLPSNGGMLLVSHDLHLVRHTCTRVLIMRSGQIIERCSTGDLGAVPHHPYTDTLLRAAGLKGGDVP